jgi:PTS system galactitol-specific IIA component
LERISTFIKGGGRRMEFKGLLASPNLIVCGSTAKSSEDVIKKLTGLALEQGFIEPIFTEKILEREKAYPTGLPTEVPIAIPHVHDGCLRSFFSMMTLKDPVEFNCMGDPDEKVLTRLVFLFGITDPSQQTAVLRKFSTIFQDAEFLIKCIDCEDSSELLKLMKSVLEEYIVF